ncbi:UvrD-helicase domain-containing protein [Desulfovibrio sp. OttesenSCG-928-G11]|nr:UvrD-helicase domain-containing protein [Desulfovibrio sp. OttesenSCG-928-G11]
MATRPSGMILQISASAGSGKTYALTRRFLELLQGAEKSGPLMRCALDPRPGAYLLPEILAATFTNKAASEMKERVLEALKEQALAEGAGQMTGPDPDSASTDQGSTGRHSGSRGSKSWQNPAPGRAEVWVEHILRHFASLNIRTIDSLLYTLVRLSALMLELPPDFTPSFSSAEYFTPVYDGLMEDLAGRGPVFDRIMAPDAYGVPAFAEGPLFLSADAALLRERLHEACRSLLHQGDFSGFSCGPRIRALCLELVEMLLRGQELPKTDSQAIHASLRLLHSEATRACRDLLQSFEDHGLAVNGHYRNFLQTCAAAPLWRPLCPGSAQHGKKELDDCLNKSSRNLAPEAAHQAFIKARKAMDEYGRALPLFVHALRLAPLADLARELHLRMELARKERGITPAALLPRLAVAALDEGRGVSDAMCRLGARLTHLMLDEFQDTSREQWAAILPLAVECLSTGGSLLYVGDVKQAIYGWRGGDARLFDEPRADPELAAMAEARAESLPCNWRSHPAIVRLNNAFFSLPGEPDLALPLMRAMLPPETPESYLRQAAARAGEYFSRCAQEIPKARNWDADPRAPHAVARLYEVEADYAGKLRDLVRQRLGRLFFEELLPVWSYSDIAVLVRSAAEGALAAEWLTGWGLPVVTESSFLLAKNPLVGRLMAFLGFLDYPLDDAALMDFLQAGFLGDLAGLPRGEDPDAPDIWDAWAAALVMEHGKERPPLYRLLRRDFPDLWQRLIEPFYAQAGLMSAYDTLSEAMSRFGLFELYPEQAPFLRRLLELAHMAEQRGQSSLAAFLAFWREAGEEEKLPLPENMNAVRIMTIHKAKGLEFNVVILPFQHTARRHSPGPTAARVLGLDLLTRALPELPDLYYPACITDELERLNLLYVAWTRPVYALHAFLTRPRRSPTPLSRGLTLLADSLKKRHGPDLCQWETLSEEKEEEEDLQEVTALEGSGPGEGAPVPISDGPRHPEAPPPLPWRPMDWLPGLRIFRSPLEAARFSPRQRGILFHLCLEHLHLAGPASLEADVDRAVSCGLRLFPLALSEPDRAAEETRAALLWFASLPRSALWLRWGRREQSLMDSEGRLHRVDLLVDEADYQQADASAGAGGLLALDYKSGSDRERQGAHREQVRRYMRLLRAATGRRARGLLVYLDERRLLEIEAEEEA